MAKNNRGKKPSDKTAVALWIAAGGRCQFEGCNERLYKDDLTQIEFNGANIAHIVAALPNGPRGNEQSHDLSDNIDNLMLLCPKHHKLIDGQPERFSTETLKNMKRKQEQMVCRLLDSMLFPKCGCLLLESSIKGITKVLLDPNEATKTLYSEKLFSIQEKPMLLDLESYGEYNTSIYWNQLEEKLEDEFRFNVAPFFKYNPDAHLAVFPLAPIPLIAKLGELLSDKKEIHIFQRFRSPDDWKWRKQEQSNHFVLKRVDNPEGNPEKGALILSLTAEINEDRVKAVCDAGTIYHIKADQKDVYCILSPEDLKAFWVLYQKACDLMKNVDRLNSIDVFPAVPVSAAFEIGYRYMPSTYPILNIYDEYNGFFKALTIGGNYAR